MLDSKTPKALILILILALAGAVAVAGCGGGDSSSAPESTAEEAPPAAEEEPAEEEPAEEAEEEPAGQEGGGEGKTIFTSNCASCHTLKAAGTTGEVGPNLDELEPDKATVEKQVTDGGGGMPAFGGTLSPEEIEEVATFVSTEAGK